MTSLEDLPQSLEAPALLWNVSTESEWWPCWLTVGQDGNQVETCRTGWLSPPPMRETMQLLGQYESHPFVAFNAFQSSSRGSAGRAAETGLRTETYSLGTVLVGLPHELATQDTWRACKFSVSCFDDWIPPVTVDTRQQGHIADAGELEYRFGDEPTANAAGVSLTLGTWRRSNSRSGVSGKWQFHAAFSSDVTRSEAEQIASDVRLLLAVLWGRIPSYMSMFLQHSVQFKSDSERPDPIWSRTFKPWLEASDEKQPDVHRARLDSKVFMQKFASLLPAWLELACRARIAFDLLMGTFLFRTGYLEERLLRLAHTVEILDEALNGSMLRFPKDEWRGAINVVRSALDDSPNIEPNLREHALQVIGNGNNPSLQQRANRLFAKVKSEQLSKVDVANVCQRLKTARNKITHEGVWPSSAGSNARDKLRLIGETTVLLHARLISECEVFSQDEIDEFIARSRQTDVQPFTR